jgi:hypothetical protein
MPFSGRDLRERAVAAVLAFGFRFGTQSAERPFSLVDISFFLPSSGHPAAKKKSETATREPPSLEMTLCMERFHATQTSRSSRPFAGF